MCCKKGHKNSYQSGLLHCGVVKGAVLMVLKQGLCVSDTTECKKGGIPICSCQMCACWLVFLCVLALICIHVSEMHVGLDWQSFSRKHMF